MKMDPIELMIENIRQVNRLMEIHVELTGEDAGRRVGVEVLNKSAIVLMTACWESLVEDLADHGFNWLILNAANANSIPTKVQALACRQLRESDDERAVWSLAGDGWIKVLVQHRQATIQRYVGAFHSPKSENVDALFEDLLGIRKVSAKWKWKGMSAARARSQLDKFVDQRGDIAHRVSTSKAVKKSDVEKYKLFIFRIAAVTSNTINNYLGELTGEKPWSGYRYRSVR